MIIESSCQCSRNDARRKAADRKHEIISKWEFKNALLDGSNVPAMHGLLFGPTTIFITSNDRSFGCPIIYMDPIHIGILLIDTSTMLHTAKLILYLRIHVFIQKLKTLTDKKL